MIPEKLLASLSGIAGFNRETFAQVHTSGEQITSIRINPAKISVVNVEWSKDFIQHLPFNIQHKIPWTSFGYYLSQRPSFTFDPFFHAGCYYVQEASGMFLEQALKQPVDTPQPLKVLDLCAAPGGKSTHLQSLLTKDSLLVSNEVIKNRATILKQNIIKWGCSNVIVTNNDPQHFSKLSGFFDIIVVDAPCSGSGLFRKDIDAIEEWSEENVLLCCGRQKRILKDALPALKENGILIYSTCSYSKEEDEDIADWLVEKMDMENVPLKIDSNWGIVESGSAKTNAVGYRFYPDKVKGEGFFLSCFRKKEAAAYKSYKPQKPEVASAKETATVAQWLRTKDIRLLKFNDTIFAWPESLVQEFAIIKSALNIQYAGTTVGTLIREKLIPDHALALSNLLLNNIQKVEISYEEAIKYLQKGELNWNVATTGWNIVSYQNKNLGWVNILPNRINNYYPKELRILKRSDNEKLHPEE